MTNLTAVRLTFPARVRFPDIGAHQGLASEIPMSGWYRVEWPGNRTTWLRGEDIEHVTNTDDHAFPPFTLDGA